MYFHHFNEMVAAIDLLVSPYLVDNWFDLSILYSILRIAFVSDIIFRFIFPDQQSSIRYNYSSSNLFLQ